MKRVYFIRVQLSKASKTYKPKLSTAQMCEGIIHSWSVNRSTFLYGYEMRIVR